MKMSHLSNGVSRNQKRKARRLIQCAMVGAAVSLAVGAVPALAQVRGDAAPQTATPQVSSYAGDTYLGTTGITQPYDLTKHQFQIVTVPDYEAYPAMPISLYQSLYPNAKSIIVGNAQDAPYVSSTDYSTHYTDSTLNLRQALGIANETTGPNASTGPVIITENITTTFLTTGNGPIVIDNPNAQVVFKSKTFNVYQGTSGSTALTFPGIDVKAGSVLFYDVYNSPGRPAFPIKIEGTGQVNVFAFGVDNGGWINLSEMDDSAKFLGSRYTQVNKSTSYAGSPVDLSTLNLNDNSYFELGENNTIFSSATPGDVNVNDNSTFILNGGNVLSSGEPAPNTLYGNLNIGDGDGSNNAYAVLGIQNLITGNVTVNNDGTLRSLGPTDINGDLEFKSGSTFIASLGTPVNAQEFHFDTTGTHPGFSGTSPNGTTTEAVTPYGNLPWWSTSNSTWTTQYPNFATQMIDPTTTLPGQPGYYAPPAGTYLLKVVNTTDDPDSTITIDDGANMVIDSLTSLGNIGQKYIIFKVEDPSDLSGTFNITNALTSLTFSDPTLDETPDTIDGLYDYYITLTGRNIASLVGGNKSQRSFLTYLNNLNENVSPFPDNANAALTHIINNFNDIGPDATNSFLGNSYAAHDAQLYWNQSTFVHQVNDQLTTERYMDSGQSTFHMNASGLGDVYGQLFSLRQSLNNSRSGLAGVLNANGANSPTNNGVWASLYGDRVNTDGDSSLGSMGWDGSTTGVAAGYTGGDEHFKWGVAAGHQKSNLDFNNLLDGASAEGTVEGYNVGLYGALNHKKSYLNGILSYSHFDNDATRNDQVGGNTSSFNSHGIAAQLEYGIHMHQSKASDITPYASLLWTRDDRDGFTEQGDGAGLSVDGDSHSIFTSQLGVRYNHRTYDKDTGALKGGLQAGVAWVHQFGDTDFPLTARFNDDPSGFSFNSYGTPLSSNAAQVQLGAYGRIHNNVIGFVNYQGTFGGNEHVNSVTGGLGYQF